MLRTIPGRLCIPARAGVAVIAAALALFLLAPPSSADLYNNYELRPEWTFSLPGVQVPGKYRGGTVMDNLPDGRLVLVATRMEAFSDWYGAAELFVESAPGSRTFDYRGDLSLPVGDPLWGSPGAFLTVQQGGASPRVAIGNNYYSVGVFEAAALDGTGVPAVTWFQLSGTLLPSSAAWYDDNRLAVAMGAFGAPSQVNLLDVTSSPASPAAPAVVTGLQGATGGVAFDADGNLYFGNGFANGLGSATGTIKRFAAAALAAALTSSPLDYESDGTMLGALLSAAHLGFDAEGNLLVGGGDFSGSGQLDFAAVVQMPGGLAAPRMFDPDTGSDWNTYSVAYNEARGEIYLWDFFGSTPDTVYVVSAVPEPSGLALGALAAAGWIVLLFRRRRPGHLSP